MRRLATLVIVAAALGVAAMAQAQPAELVIAPDDEVVVVVDGQPDMTGLYLVEPNGSLQFPLVGPVQVAGLTAQTLTSVLTEALTASLASPVVRVEVRQPRRVFVFGEVERPGLYELTDRMTVLELLLQSGYSGVSEVLLARTGNVRTPVLPDQAEPSDVMRVNLRQLESDARRGDLSRNVLLETGDTVFVPSLDPNTVFVSGEVNNPGAYSLPDGTTVLQALTLAGWVSDQGAVGRTRVVRFEGEERTERRVRLDEEVVPGDTLVVPEPYFNPSFSAAGGAPALSVGELSLGPVLTLTPSLPLTQVGIDSNVVLANGQRNADFVVELRPEIGAALDLGRAQVDGYVAAGLVYYRRFQSQRAVEPGYGSTISVDLARMVELTASHDFRSTRQRFSFELDPRVRQETRTTIARLAFGPWGRVGFHLEGNATDNNLPQSVFFAGEDLQRTLEQRSRQATAGVEFELSPASTLALSFIAGAYRFPLFKERDADSSEIRGEVTFGTRSVVQGRAHIGYLRYGVFAPMAPDYRGPVVGGELWRELPTRTELGVRGERGTTQSFLGAVSFALLDRYGGWVRQALTDRFDVVQRVDQEEYNYQDFGLEGPGGLQATDFRAARFSTQFGVLLGDSRVAVEAMYQKRGGEFAFNAWQWGIVYNYGVFHAGTRAQ